MRLAKWIAAVARNHRRRVDRPRFLTYIVTFACNARCIMCDSWKKPAKGDLTLDEIAGIFDQLPHLDAVRLTGGEPFVRKDLLEIAQLAQEKLRPMVLHVTSNGFLPDRIVRFCEERDKRVPLQLLISVDGVEDKHNHVRGHDKAWDRAMQTLEALAPRQKELRLKLAVNQTVVDAEGARHYSLLRERLRPLGIANHLVMAYDVSATYSVESEVEAAPESIGQFSTFGAFTQDEIRALCDAAEEDAAQYDLLTRIAKRYYIRGIRNRLLGGEGSPNPKCVALNSHMRLYPDGGVPTCQFNSKTIGNLRQATFEELWYGERAGRQRAWVHRCPGCWAECEVLPNAIYTGDLIRETLFPTKAPTGEPQSRPDAPARMHP